MTQLIYTLITKIGNTSGKYNMIIDHLPTTYDIV